MLQPQRCTDILFIALIILEHAQIRDFAVHLPHASHGRAILFFLPSVREIRRTSVDAIGRDDFTCA